MITSIVQAAGIALTVGLLVGAVTAWSLTGSYKDAKMDTLVATHAAQIATLKSESDEKLLEVERLKSQIQGELQSEKVQLIKEHAKRVASLSTTISDISKLVLLDPGSDRNSSTGASGGASSSTSGDNTTTAAGKALSTEATQFLWGFATDADETLETLRTCQQWVEKVETATKKYNAELKVKSPQTE